MNISDLQNKTVGILGFGQEGNSIANFLIENSITPKIFDKQDKDQLPKQYKTQLDNLKLDYFSGSDYLEQALIDCQIIFRSPGVKLSNDQLSQAKQNNITITSQAEWFFEHSPAKIIGITGTKGKGTTSSFIYEIIKASDFSHQIYLTGNIGKIQPFEILENLSKDDLVIYELSSFQLEFLNQSPHIGVCLMVTEDHLDYHGNQSDYTHAKQAITNFQTNSDYAVFNIDYANSEEIGQLGEGQKWHITAKEPVVQNGIKISGEILELYQDEKVVTSFDCEDRILRGKHNLENIAAGVAVAKILNIDNKIIQDCIKSFKGLEHRLQFVGEHSGVKYYNDSISTIPETTIAAIKSFHEPIVLLVGGATKNLSNDQLVSELQGAPNIKSIVCIGQTGQDLHAKLSNTDISHKLYGPFDNFKEAVEKAVDNAELGDIVLLSPAATSFDMFNNYKERGEKFAEIISTL